MRGQAHYTDVESLRIRLGFKNYTVIVNSIVEQSNYILASNLHIYNNHSIEYIQNFHF